MNFFESNLISCKPISSLENLLKWSKQTTDDSITSMKYNVEKLENYSNSGDEDNKPKFLVCHDMRNNYLEDKYFQGSNDSFDYTFYQWNLIDIFVYFSHHFVTIPPESWINAAHKNNVRMLGTFITEWKEGSFICNEILSNEETMTKVIDKLVELTVYYGFDGWLINIENEINNVHKLIEFLRRLNQSLKAIDSNLYKVIWYDSVIKSGELKWQNELNELNECFFNECDGIFLNYTWKDNNLSFSKNFAKERYLDVYVGVDVFGRGCFGNGGFNCDLALQKIAKVNLGVAMFAPAWIWECNDKTRLIENSEIFWNLLKDFTYRRQIKSLPLITTFTHSRANKFFLNGKLISSNSNEKNFGWSNYNLQSLMPILPRSQPNSSVDWCFEDAFYAGNSILFTGKGQYSLFDINVPLRKGQQLIIEYCFKNHHTFDSNESQIDEFYLSLVFHRNDTAKASNDLRLDLTSKSIDDIEIVDNFTIMNSQNWHTRKYFLKLKNDVHLTDLLVKFNTNSNEQESKRSIRLGLVKVFDSINSNYFLNDESLSTKLIKIDPILDKKIKVFVLLGRVYLCLYLKWNRFIDQLNYYNIFTDECFSILSTTTTTTTNQPTESVPNKLRYIGSTKHDTFRICFKLSENFQFDSTLSSTKSTKSFKIYIQAIYKNLNHLARSNINDGNLLDVVFGNNRQSVHSVLIELSTVIKSDTDSSLSFIDECVCDHESFDFV